jgi:type IV secretory pathway VirD2 relaxase
MSKREDREFRLRPRKPPIPRQKGERGPLATAFKTMAHFARASRLAKLHGAPRSGRQRRGAVLRSQRCAVRVTYARNTVRGQWRAHGRYVARESAATEPTAAGFDRSTHGIDMAATLESWQAAGDRRLWKIIISPEFGERADLIRLTRDLMERMDKDLGTPLDWVAVAHFNTEHPHVHVALRGVGQDGREFQLPREYVKAGIRSIAEDLCTRQLGHRTEMDAAEAERREVREQRFTSLDRAILRRAMPHPEGQHSTVSIPAEGWGRLEDALRLRRQNLIARLGVLERMGLARTSGPGTWSLRSDLPIVLRAMQRAADRQKTLSAHGVLISDERLPVEALDFRRTPAVEGRVLVHGEDEQSGRSYLMLEGVDARVHFIEYTPEMEAARARGELRTNAFVRFRRMPTQERAAVQIQDFGNAESLLQNRNYFADKARQLLRNGIVPVEDGWGGWLGQYQSSLKRAATKIQDQPTNRRRVRDRSHDR